MRIGELELRRSAERHARAVGTPWFGSVHLDPLTGDSLRRITRDSVCGWTAYPPPCTVCVGYPCECGMAGGGCG
jgi:hypothetical protein